MKSHSHAGTAGAGRCNPRPGILLVTKSPSWTDAAMCVPAHPLGAGAGAFASVSPCEAKAFPVGRVMLTHSGSPTWASDFPVSGEDD